MGSDRRDDGLGRDGHAADHRLGLGRRRQRRLGLRREHAGEPGSGSSAGDSGCQGHERRCRAGEGDEHRRKREHQSPRARHGKGLPVWDVERGHYGHADGQERRRGKRARPEQRLRHRQPRPTPEAQSQQPGCQRLSRSDPLSPVLRRRVQHRTRSFGQTPATGAPSASPSTTTTLWAARSSRPTTPPRRASTSSSGTTRPPRRPTSSTRSSGGRTRSELRPEPWPFARAWRATPASAASVPTARPSSAESTAA